MYTIQPVESSKKITLFRGCDILIWTASFAALPVLTSLDQARGAKIDTVAKTGYFLHLVGSHKGEDLWKPFACARLLRKTVRFP